MNDAEPNDGNEAKEEEKQDSVYERAYTEIPFDSLNAEQLSLLSAFRASFSTADNTLMSDYDCVRFLSAREWVLRDAVTMKKHNFKQRRNFQSELILQKPKDPIVDALFKLRRSGVEHNCFGKDRRGNPVFYAFQGTFISLPLYKFISTAQYLKWIRYGFEELKKYELTPSGRAQILVVLDLGGLSAATRHNHCFTKAAVQFNEAHSPEYCYRVVCVNSPKLVAGLYALLKPLLPTRTTKKISFHDVKATPSALAELIDNANLPKLYGGDVDETECFTQLSTDMSELEALRAQNASRADTTVLKLAAGQSETVRVECGAGALVKWWFVVTSYNIEFTLRWRAEAETETEWTDIREKSRVGDEGYDQHRFAVYDEHLVDARGVMAFEFSNKHSNFRAKTVEYKVQALEPVT